MFNGGGNWGSIEDVKFFEKFEENFKKDGFENGKGEKADEVTYTFKKNGKWFVKDLINNMEYSWTKKEILRELQ